MSRSAALAPAGRSSASTSARVRSRPAWSRLDGRLLAIARSGYAIDARHHGWAEQDPGAWWSAVVSAVRALRINDLAEVVAIGVDGHGPTLVAVDGRGEATRPAITWLDTRSIAEADELAAATGVRGWALAGLPAALWVERHDRAAADATRWYLSTWEWLAFRLTGAAVSPLTPNQLVPDRSAVAQRRGPDGSASRRQARRARSSGHLTSASADALGLQAGIPVAGGTVDAFASYHGAGLLRAGDAYDPGGSAGGFGVYWHRPVEVPGGFVTPAPLEGHYSVGRGDGRDRPGARLVSRRDPGRHDLHRRAARRGCGDPARRGWPRVPAVPRRRAVADLGPGGARRPRRADPGPRPRSHRAGDPGGLARWRSATSPRRCWRPAWRSARCGSVAARHEARSGTRSRPTCTGFRIAVPEVLETAVLGSADPGRLCDRGVRGPPDGDRAR